MCLLRKYSATWFFLSIFWTFPGKLFYRPSNSSFCFSIFIIDVQSGFCIFIKTRLPHVTDPPLNKESWLIFTMEDCDFRALIYYVCKKVGNLEPLPPYSQLRTIQFWSDTPSSLLNVLMALIPSCLGIDVLGFWSKTLPMRSVYYNSHKYNNTEKKASRRYSEQLSQKSVVPPMSPV